MKLGIVGLPRTGKTTVFRALTGTKDPPLDPQKMAKTRQIGLGMVLVEDERLDFLTAMSKSKKTTPVHVEYLDLGSAMEEKKQGKTMGDNFLAHIRPLDAIIHCVRFFESNMLGKPADPLQDFASFEEDMLLSDLSIVEKRLEKIEADFKKGRKELQEEVMLLKGAKETLDKGLPLRCFPQVLTSEKLRCFSFLSGKPELVVVNIGQEKTKEEAAKIVEQIRNKVKGQPNIQVDSLYADNEAEIARLDPEEAKEFLRDLQIEETAKNRIVKTSFNLLNLIVFLTTGEKESRAWSIKKSSTALIAAETIHSDIARGFIRAETVSYQDLKTHGSMNAAQKAGRVRLEGKEYIVEDGDVILFRFNV